MIGRILMAYLSLLLILVDCLGMSCHVHVPYRHPILSRTVFNDFGSKFTCVDPTGEQPLTGMIVSIAQVCAFSRIVNL